MKTLNERFESALKLINLFKRELFKIRNGKAFQNESIDVQENIIGAIEDLNRFTQKNTNYIYSDIEKEEMIDLTLEMSEKLFGIGISKV